MKKYNSLAVVWNQELKKFWIFSVCAPQLSGRILFATPDARVIFLDNDLLCNGTCSVTGANGTNGENQRKGSQIISIGWKLNVRYPICLKFFWYNQPIKNFLPSLKQITTCLKKREKMADSHAIFTTKTEVLQRKCCQLQKRLNSKEQTKIRNYN